MSGVMRPLPTPKGVMRTVFSSTRTEMLPSLLTHIAPIIGETADGADLLPNRFITLQKGTAKLMGPPPIPRKAESIPSHSSPLSAIPAGART